MRWVICAILIAAAIGPAFGQKLYSYRDKDGNLVITDRPIDSKAHKLVDTYTPEHLKKKDRENRTRTSRYSNRQRSTGSKTQLSRTQVRGLATPIARAFGVDPDLVMSVVEIESSRNMKAKSSKGAMGLMQLMPATAERFGVDNPWNPRENIKGGVLYLRYLLSYFEGNVDYVLAAYNAGENAVDRHKGIPPYKETRNYVRKIRKIYSPKTLPYGDVAKRRSALVSGKTPAKQLIKVSGASE